MPLDPQASSSVAASFPVFEVRQVTSPELHHPHYVVDCPDWVAIVAVTADDQVVLVRQFRAGVSDFTLEPPGGVIEPGQSPLQAAQRELFEETGYDGPLTRLGSVHPNPALMTNRSHVYLARPAHKIAEPTFDGEGEHCEVVLIPVRDIGAAMSNGAITHVIGLAALSSALGIPVVLGEVP